MKNEGFTLRKRLRSFKFAGNGIRLLITREHNAWIQKGDSPFFLLKQHPILDIPLKYFLNHKESFTFLTAKPYVFPTENV